MTLTQLTLGDHLVASHLDNPCHGMLVSNDQVIHCQAVNASHESCQLVLTSLAEFCQGQPLQIKPHPHRLFSREESITRAHARLGEQDAGQSFTDGEQFVSWCIDGSHRSPNLVPTVVASMVAAEVARHTLGKAATTTAAGIAATTLTATTTSGTATATVMASAAGVVSAPILAPLAVGAVAVYSVAKLWDWLSD
ncbi:hypothetical protein AO724_12580 [Aeromonas allosaccharophila]|uniref:hypothetical protein n=1 Tax=Aeromonas allosaccharophila TaxID=656 RepID=UPI000717FC26|nr:hypothetical protein [Aeromonas allosaccharophila]KRW63056.1 hypothetical protein AO724_12580 [Aeromonas allosaccharophila]